jgi:hypothetical protein
MLLPKLNHEANEAKARVELLDMWQITRTREDATSEHSDKVGPRWTSRNDVGRMDEQWNDVATV